MDGDEQLKDFVEFNKSRADEMLRVMRDDFNERVTDHYNMYTSLIKKLEERDEKIKTLSQHIDKAHIKIQSLEQTIRELSHGNRESG